MSIFPLLGKTISVKTVAHLSEQKLLGKKHSSVYIFEKGKSHGAKKLLCERYKLKGIFANVIEQCIPMYVCCQCC